MRTGAALALALAALAAGCGGDARGSTAAGELRVCADPNNLPFSNQREEGFENRLAELLADEMRATVAYTWWPQRRSFLRNTLRAHECDVVMGVPTGYELVHATRPYYRSTYVFVYPADQGWEIRSFDDPVLHELKVGVHLIGDDGANAPPAHALARRGMVDNVRGYLVYGDYSEDSPPARILDALETGEIDVAVVWGPLAGYFAPRASIPLAIVPVAPEIDLPFLPMVYDISLGVRRGDTIFARRLEEILVRRRPGVDSLLASYGVPLR